MKTNIEYRYGIRQMIPLWIRLNMTITGNSVNYNDLCLETMQSEMFERGDYDNTTSPFGGTVEFREIEL